jgi:hypothetical protein
LRIAGHIAAGTTAIDKLAAASGADADSLHRVLRHLVSKGVFEEPEPGQFALNEIARSLLDDSSRFLDLDGFGGRMAHVWELCFPRFERAGRRITRPSVASFETTWTRIPKSPQASTG